MSSNYLIISLIAETTVHVSQDSHRTHAEELWNWTKQ